MGVDTQRMRLSSTEQKLILVTFAKNAETKTSEKSTKEEN